ncbi:MAG TPA: PhoU domain-containing protein [Nitrososphaeraceae archaeon]|nr:PhoU domain-containing protein [Nitrososphaeraceae archaeon]
MTRLLDRGLKRLTNIIMDMAKLSEMCVTNAIESYENGIVEKTQIFEWSEKLKIFQLEVSDLATELIMRYQPVATDLRYIRSCMEIAYGFSRFGRYAYDIVELLETIGSFHKCDKSLVLETSNVASEMIRLSINALQTKEKNTVSELYKMDDSVDALYTNYLKDLITLKTDSNDHPLQDPRCAISALLIMRYLERIADHACYIGDSVYFIATGESSPRK